MFHQTVTQTTQVPAQGNGAQQQPAQAPAGPGAFEGGSQATGGMEGASHVGINDATTQKSMEAMTKLRLILKKRGCHGIITLGRKFKSMDDDGSGSLCYVEFTKAMKEMGFDEGELQALFRFFDRDCNGYISYDEFITGLRGDLNERRKKLVFLAYGVMDVTGDGRVDMQDMVARYDVSQHPDFISGSRTKFEIIREFMDVFDGGEKDGVITPLEFAQYYSSVSANIDDDDYFELMIRNSWHISGGEGWCENTTCRRVLVTHPDGSQTVEEIKDDMDVGKDDKDEMKKNLKQQGINAAHIDTTGSCDQATPEPIHPTQPKRSDFQNIKAKQTQSSIIF
ncbi:hypothetical protein BSKO_08084 [Bryopsis sp. KO-2023]|nr:hypothetical protein BSKO_08084 [Bryopsis sp. KO-2023]